MSERDELLQYTIPQLLRYRVQKMGDRVALREKDFGIWRSLTWKQYYDYVGKTALGLESDPFSPVPDQDQRFYYAFEAFEQRLTPGEALLLCSDGLSGMVPNDQMWLIWNTSTSPQETCDRLVEAANQAGGVDNITVVIVQMTE